ncbi:hypothetical protein HPB50_019682 [Hyalomma asiaticum]|uniref:Uncharacterized protein n=1 Tax=Hyalomma asiaticum TaxID=266040 RepID=A0ACB7TJ10_HYAAI|nr:hypothetical protein HPB50_019682 [Hyalomma asiaticum]
MPNVVVKGELEIPADAALSYPPCQATVGVITCAHLRATYVRWGGVCSVRPSAWRQLRPLAIANCFAHAGFSGAPESIEEDIDAELSGCDELCNEVHKATGCIAFVEYALYEAGVPVTRMLSDADIMEMAVNDADEDVDEVQPRQVPTTTETRNMLRLHRNKVECSGGD